MKNILFICILSALSGYSQTKDTFEVYFPFNDPKLAKEAEAYIDQLIFKDTLIHGDKLILLGFADFVGGKGHNDSLSVKRANNVLRYLMNSGFDKSDIRLCIGKGKIDRTGIYSRDGYAPDRKVQIIIDRTVLPKPAPKPKESFDINTLKVNETVALNNILFQPDLPFLLDGSKADLEKIYVFMKDHPSVKIRIEGHICCWPLEFGFDKRYMNGYLSEYRAASVRGYLVKKGIDSSRMSIVGLGNRAPLINPEVTEDDRIRNRRVEVRILSK